MKPYSDRSSRSSNNRFKWWHAVLIFVVANLIGALPAGFGGDKVFYTNFKLPPVAPPDWLFAPMWLFLNVTSLIALYRVANASGPAGPRRAFLILEGCGWILFAVFATLYFAMRSPILGAADTLAGLIIAIASTSISARFDRTAAFCIFLRVAWLALAGYVAVYAARNNRDEFFSGMGF